MTTSTRYSFVRNTLGAPFTINNFPYNSDGDDKKVITVKRLLGTGDIGTAAGQVGHELGAIALVLPSGSNVLMIEGLTYRPTAPVSGSTPLSLMDGAKLGAVYCEVGYLLGTDNTIRVHDFGAGGAAALADDDLVIIRVTIGSPEDPFDSMN